MTIRHENIPSGDNVTELSSSEKIWGKMSFIICQILHLEC